VKDLSGAVSAALKNVPREIIVGPRPVIRPEIIGIIIRDPLQIKNALGTAEAIRKDMAASAKGNPALTAIATSEAGVLITRGGILAGFIPARPPIFEL
jgi:hypothetical protein